MVAGDRIVASASYPGRVRTCVVLEVLRDDGPLRYRVRWQDTGEETLFVPGSGVRVGTGSGGVLGVDVTQG